MQAPEMIDMVASPSFLGRVALYYITLFALFLETFLPVPCVRTGHSQTPSAMELLSKWTTQTAPPCGVSYAFGKVLILGLLV